MQRGRSLTTSRRGVVVPLSPVEAWDVVASGRTGTQWYVDALPFAFRRTVDRLALGPALRLPPPGRDRLAAGDRVGFWDVVRADHRARELELEARVRAPGTVRLAAGVTPYDGEGGGSLVDLAVTFDPRGLLGHAYRLADLPAREVVVEMVALHLSVVCRRRAVQTGA